MKAERALVSYLSFFSQMGLRPLWGNMRKPNCVLLFSVAYPPWLTDNWFQKASGKWEAVSCRALCLWVSKAGHSLAKPWSSDQHQSVPALVLKWLRPDSHWPLIFELPSNHHCHNFLRCAEPLGIHGRWRTHNQKQSKISQWSEEGPGQMKNVVFHVCLVLVFRCETLAMPLSPLWFWYFEQEM